MFSHLFYNLSGCERGSHRAVVRRSRGVSARVPFVKLCCEVSAPGGGGPFKKEAPHTDEISPALLSLPVCVDRQQIGAAPVSASSGPTALVRKALSREEGGHATGIFFPTVCLPDRSALSRRRHLVGFQKLADVSSGWMDGVSGIRRETGANLTS